MQEADGYGLSDTPVQDAAQEGAEGDSPTTSEASPEGTPTAPAAPPAVAPEAEPTQAPAQAALPFQINDPAAFAEWQKGMIASVTAEVAKQFLPQQQQPQPTQPQQPQPKKTPLQKARDYMQSPQFAALKPEDQQALRANVERMENSSKMMFGKSADEVAAALASIEDLKQQLEMQRYAQEDHQSLSRIPVNEQADVLRHMADPNSEVAKFVADPSRTLELFHAASRYLADRKRAQAEAQGRQSKTQAQASAAQLPKGVSRPAPAPQAPQGRYVRGSPEFIKKEREIMDRGDFREHAEFLAANP